MILEKKEKVKERIVNRLEERMSFDSLRLQTDSCVPGEGIEPSRQKCHRFLRPTRLPIPPPRHLKAFLILL